MSKLRASIRRVQPYVKKSRNELVTQAAKGFIRDIVAITPPASQGVTGTAARKAGETIVQTDLLKIVQPVLAVGRGARAALASKEEILAAHERARVPSSGRVNPRNRKDKLFAAQNVVLAIIASLKREVGWLAAGWITAATRLSVALPAWVRRHPTSPGDLRKIDRLGLFRLELESAVKFVGNVSDYQRRVQKVIDYQARKLDRVADAMIKKALRDSGLT